MSTHTDSYPDDLCLAKIVGLHVPVSRSWCSLLRSFLLLPWRRLAGTGFGPGTGAGTGAPAANPFASLFGGAPPPAQVIASIASSHAPPDTPIQFGREEG